MKFSAQGAHAERVPHRAARGKLFLGCLLGSYFWPTKQEHHFLWWQESYIKENGKANKMQSALAHALPFSHKAAFSHFKHWELLGWSWLALSETRCFNSCLCCKQHSKAFPFVATLNQNKLWNLRSRNKTDLSFPQPALILTPQEPESRASYFLLRTAWAVQASSWKPSVQLLHTLCHPEPLIGGDGWGLKLLECLKGKQFPVFPPWRGNVGKQPVKEVCSHHFMAQRRSEEHKHIHRAHLSPMLRALPPFIPLNLLAMLAVSKAATDIQRDGYVTSWGWE